LNDVDDTAELRDLLRVNQVAGVRCPPTLIDLWPHRKDRPAQVIKRNASRGRSNPLPWHISTPFDLRYRQSSGRHSSSPPRRWLVHLGEDWVLLDICNALVPN